MPTVRKIGAKLISITGHPTSRLARWSDVPLDLGRIEEACPMGLVPTSSTTATLALGDALAMAASRRRRFTREDYALYHRGGSLGRQLMTVGEIMRKGAEVASVKPGVTVADALRAVSRIGGARAGATLVVDGRRRLVGIFTDGDLRRALDRNLDVRATTMADVMTRSPRAIGPDELAAEAVLMMEKHSINGLLVLDGGGRLVGALNVHDLLRAGVM